MAPPQGLAGILEEGGKYGEWHAETQGWGGLQLCIGWALAWQHGKTSVQRLEARKLVRKAWQHSS